jgi:hypothetical protein
VAHRSNDARIHCRSPDEIARDITRAGEPPAGQLRIILLDQQSRTANGGRSYSVAGRGLDHSRSTVFTITPTKVPYAPRPASPGPAGCGGVGPPRRH